jgi:peptidoglycan/LPS O-acetylase OafA/YrhL
VLSVAIVKNFRKDIQGLRAFAVLAVVFFHISPTRLPGGFLGVDVFFVISGYLIIGFICRDLYNGQFKLSHFYIKRIRRLFPAFFVTIFFSAILAYFLLLPEEISAFAESVISSVFYVSNLYFYSQSDYFADTLGLAPLLHTWSLSVEEQFYIVFPLILIMTFHFFKRRLYSVLVVLALLSFFLSAYLVNYDRSLAFFISPTRFWQFIVGGLLALKIDTIILNEKSSNTFGFIGLITLIVCLFLYNEETLFPGVNALIPTLATLLILLAGQHTSTFTRLMSLPINQFFGNISYSLYLWHWPIIVFYGFAVTNELSGMANNTIVLGLSVFLGYLSWRYVEVPMKVTKLVRNDRTQVYLAFSVSAITVAIMFTWLGGVPSRFSETQLYYSSFMNYDQSRFRQGECFLTIKSNDYNLYDKSLCITADEEKYNTILIGDSHAAHWYSSLIESANENQTVSQLTSSGCRPLLSAKGKKRCTDLIEYAYQDLIKTQRFDKIILSGRWETGDVDALLETTRYLSNLADNVVVLGPTLEYQQSLPRILAMTSPEKLENDKHNQYSFFKKVDSKFKMLEWPKQVTYISTIDILCTPNNLPCKTVTDKGVPLAFDYGHMTHEGASFLLSLSNFNSVNITQ